MDRNADHRLLEFAANHHGVFRGAHARICGLSDRQIEGRIELGLWRRLHIDVYVIAGSPLTWRGSLLAACWAGGFRAAASHRSAAGLWALAGGGKSIVEITCPRWRRAQHDGLVVHRLAKPGRNGAGTLRHLLEGRDSHRRPPESEMETMLIQCLRRNGWPEPVPQHVIRQAGAFVARVDAAYPEWRIAIEYQSDAHHGGKTARYRDNERRLRVIAAGWFPVEAMLPDVRSGGVKLCAALRAARNRLASTTHAMGG